MTPKYSGEVGITVVDVLASYFVKPPGAMTRVSCQKGPICHALAWRVGPFLYDTLELKLTMK